MTSFRVRPGFKLQMDIPAEELIERWKLKSEDLSIQEDCNISFYAGRMKLQIPGKDQHYWTPELEVHIEEMEGGTLLTGKYGPHQNVWTLFVTLYALGGVILMVTLLFGLARWSIGMSAKILWAVPIVSILLITLYLMSQFGQKLGAEQTFQLHNAFQELVGEKIQIH